MAKVYDLTAKLSVDKPIIKIGDREFEVNDDHKVVLKVHSEMQTKNESEAIEFVLESLLGKESKEEIYKLGLSFGGIKTLFVAVMAAASGEELEEAESRFQQVTK